MKEELKKLLKENLKFKIEHEIEEKTDLDPLFHVREVKYVYDVKMLEISFDGEVIDKVEISREMIR